MEQEILKFKTAEEKQAAIAALGDAEDAPAGTPINAEYLAEYDQKLDSLMNSEIDPDYEKPADLPPGEDPPPDPNAPADPPPTPEPPPTDPPPDDPVERATAPLRSQIEALRQERSSMVNDFQKKQDDMAKKIEELQKQKPLAEPKPPEPDVASEVTKEMDLIQKEIENVEEEMNGIDADDTEKRAELAEKHAKKTSRLTILLRKSHVEAIKKYNTELGQVKEENKKREDDLKRRQDADEKKRKQQANEEARVKQTEAFRTRNAEFQGSKSYKQMEKEHAAFAYEVATRYFGKRSDQITPAEAEVAMAAFVDKVPNLMSKITDLKEPEDLRKYMLLSEIEMTQAGLELDKYTGNWNQRTDARGNKVILPDMETAYDYVKKTKGIAAQEITDMQKKTAQNVKVAMDRRTDPGEIDSPHLREGLGNDMTKEEAIEIMNSHDEEELQLIATQALKGGKPLPKKVEYVNRALAVLGMDPIVG